MIIGDGILRVKQFLLEQVKAVIIQRELDFEGSIGYTPMPLEECEYPFEYLIEVHHRPSDNSSNRALASIKSAVSNPSVNQLYTGASRSWASWRLPCLCHNRARLVAMRNLKDLACWVRAISRACRKQDSA